MNVPRWFTELVSPSKGEEKNSLLKLILTDVLENDGVDDVASKCLSDGSHLCTFILRFSKCWTEYHHFSKDAIADAFPDGYPIHVEDYNKFKPDFDRYGFTFTYKNAQLIIHHPWESKNESFQLLQGFLSE